MTTTATTATVYQVSVSTFVPYDGEYFTAYYATSVAAAQRLLVAAIEANGWALDDYDVANWNGTSVSSVRKAITDNYSYHFDAGHGNSEGKPRVMVNISEARVNSRKGAREFAKECATALAAGKLGDITARETRKKATYPTKPTTPKPMPTTNPNTLSEVTFVTLNVHPESSYRRYNGQRLEVREVLCNGNLALVLPDHGGNTADFTPAEVLDFTPANAELVALPGKVVALTPEETDEMHTVAAAQINLALKAGRAVVLRSAGEADALVGAASVKDANGKGRGAGAPRLHLTLVETPEAAYQPYPWERVIIEQPAAPGGVAEAWRANMPEALKDAIVAMNNGAPIQEATLDWSIQEAKTLMANWYTSDESKRQEPSHPEKIKARAIEDWLMAYNPAQTMTLEFRNLA